MPEILSAALAVSLVAAQPSDPGDSGLKRVVADYVGLYRRDSLPQWRALFLSSFTVASTKADGSVRLRGLEDFYAAQESYLATGRAVEETLENVAVERKGRLASVWADFVLSDDGTKNRGKLCLLLIQEEGSWRIQSLVFAYDDANAP